MGFVKRYWQEAEEKKIPHYHRVVIVELQTGSARVQRRGLANLSDQQFPELPLEFSTYEEAFAWVERKLTPRAADIATADGKFCKCGWSLERHGGMNCLYRDAANANRSADTMTSKRKLIRDIAAIISTSKNRGDKLAYYVIDKVLEWKSIREEVGTTGNILDFIQGFNKNENNDVLKRTFTQGYCYYFSVILRERFPGGAIVYAPIMGHFLYKIQGKLYDITGEVDVDIYHDFEIYPDHLQKERIIRDCVLKVEPPNKA